MERSWSKLSILGLQHAFTMFGATVLVPILTGLDISVTLFMTGVGTLLFHLITKGKVPAYMGSSFAFIVPITVVASKMTMTSASGGLFVAGLIHVVFAILMYYFGSEKILRFFPPVVTGPMIMVIGLKLAPVAINMAKDNWILAICSFTIVVTISVFGKGFIKIVPVIFGIIGGYIIALLFGWIDFSAFHEVSQIVALPNFQFMSFDVNAIMIIAPVALVTLVEHVGDVLAIGATVDKDFVKDPGLHRTLLGDGVATAVSSMFGGPVCTTYSENTGVLALTKAWDPIIMRIAAIIAIVLGFVPKVGAFIRTIPTPIIGGISIVLFGMIASVGIRTVVENKVDFTSSRNLIISATILVIGLGGVSIEVSEVFTIDGMALSAVLGIILNILLPSKKTE